MLLRTLLVAVSLPCALALLGACGGNAGQGADDWTASSTQPLLCQGEGIHPEGCPITKPTFSAPAFPQALACPAGTTCSFAETSVVTNDACSSAYLYLESGASPAQYLVTYCMTALGGVSDVDGFVSSHAAESAVQTSALPALPVAPAGMTYIRWNLATAVPPVFPASVCPSWATVCSFAPSSLPAPAAACTAPQWFSGEASTNYLVSTCMTVGGGLAEMSAFASANPTLDVGEATQLVGLPPAPGGTTYLQYTLPTPTTLPSTTSSDGDTGYATPSIMYDGLGNPLPCSPTYEFGPYQIGGIIHWVTYCVDTPSVDTWFQQNLSHTIWGTTESPSTFDLPVAAPGYTYIDVTGEAPWIIGGSCARGCSHG